MLTLEKQTPDNPTYYYQSTGKTEKELRADMSVAWVEALKRIRENRADGTWNRLIFECWCEQGFLEIYPQQRGESPHLKKPLIVVSLDFLTDTKNKVDQANDDSEVRSLLAVATVKLDNAIRQSYRREPALAELKTTLETNDFTCWTMRTDNLETLMKFHLLF